MTSVKGNWRSYFWKKPHSIKSDKVSAGIQWALEHGMSSVLWTTLLNQPQPCSVTTAKTPWEVLAPYNSGWPEDAEREQLYVCHTAGLQELPKGKLPLCPIRRTSALWGYCWISKQVKRGRVGQKHLRNRIYPDGGLFEG